MMNSVLRIASLYWIHSPYGVRRKAFGHAGTVLILEIVRAKVAAGLAEASGRLLAKIGSDGFQRKHVAKLLSYKASLLIVLSVINIIHAKVLRELTTCWSEVMTRQLLAGYVELGVASVTQGESPRSLEKLSEDCPFDSDNMDQHVAEDVDKFVNLFSDQVLQVLNGATHLYFFTKSLNAISPVLARATVIMATLGTALTVFFGRSLPWLYNKEREMANKFRYALTRVRENAESISFYRGEACETSRLLHLHSDKLDSLLARKARRDIVSTVSTIYRKLGSMVPVLLFLRFNMKSPKLSNSQTKDGFGYSANVAGQLTQSSEAFGEILFHLMIVAENLNDFSRLSAVAKNLEDLLRHVAKPIDWPDNDSDGLLPKYYEDHTIEIFEKRADQQPNNAPWMSIQNLTIYSRGSTLVYSLSMCLEWGSRLLIVGESGVGKTTFLRTISGLCTTGSGLIVRPSRDSIFFIPQRPYMTLGTLREQLFYPSDTDTTYSDIQLVDVLDQVGLISVLSRLSDGLDSVEKWTRVLSFGEQQRLAFARLLLQKPEKRRYVFLDESTSALDIMHEEKMYTILNRSCQCWVSVGHRTSIEKFHNRKLTLRTDGGWNIESL